MELRTYLETAPRGSGASVARQLGVNPVMVSQWAAGAKPVPEDRAPALEAATGFQVRCEDVCPGARWVRVAADGWPAGKPLLDKSPTVTAEVTDPPAPDRRRGDRRASDEQPAGQGA